eukprot:TRINITY_DN10775_c0_g2_i1.p1 TRINITY_DN10775_c0_g2~~TRINITY_DN10775_c0_g2_i1.p1  ORF type:complete len:660 (+),score=208.18 TRINITY_DN10775_c0_g2_i1:46-1980(+)
MAEGWNDNPEVKAWLRPAETVKYACPCSAVGTDGIRRGCVALAVDDRFCVVDAAKPGKLLDSLEHGFITNMYYFCDEEAWVLDLCDRMLALKLPRSVAEAFVRTTVIYEPSEMQIHPTVAVRSQAKRDVVKQLGMSGFLGLLWKEPARNPYTAKVQGPLIPPGAAVIGAKTRLEVGDVDLSELPDVVQSMLEESDLRLVRAEGRGRTLLAGRAFKAGEVAWQEQPFLCWPAGCEAETGAEMWRDPSHIGHRVFNFLQAHDSPPVALPTAPVPEEVNPPPEFCKRWQDVLNVNCWGFNHEEGDCRALFAVGSMFNHSCEPNVRYDTRAGQPYAVFRTLRDVPEGEELLVAYTTHLSLPRRYDELLCPRRFRCMCPRCVNADVARTRRCPRGVRCRGLAAPTLIKPGRPEDGAMWGCDSCSDTFAERYDSVATTPAHAEAEELDGDLELWVIRLVETHMTACDLNDPPAALIAALIFAAESLSLAHYTVVALAISVLNRDQAEEYTSECYVLLARVVLNWCLQICPGSILHHSDAVQALSNAIAKLQALDESAGTLPMISVAHHLVGPFTIFRGAGDKDAVGMRTVSSLRPNAWDALLGFDWRCASGDTDALLQPLRGKAPFSDRVQDRLDRIRKGWQDKSDPYEM